MHAESRNTDDFLFFRYETFINFFWLLVFRHEERKTQFLLCWLFLLRSSVNSPAELSAQSQNLNSLAQQTRASSRRPQTGMASPRFEYQLASLRDRSQLTAFFKNQQNSHPLASGHDVILTPVSFSISGFYYDICDCHILREREHLHSVCAPARALSWIVLSLTKPNDKI